MDIKKRLRQALTEAKHKNKTHKNEYGCLMIYLDVDKNKWGEIGDMFDKDDLYEPADDSSYGFEKSAHVTILFGLHNDIPDSDIEEEINKIKTPKIEFKGVSSFTNKLFDVIKFDVESEDLHKLNKRFTKFPHTTDFPNYHPHVTIAYVKPKLADKYIKRLSKHIDMPMTPSKIVYSKSDGSKKTYKLN